MERPPEPSTADAKLTVIVTAFDRRSFLTDAIESALRQTLHGPEVEIVVLTNFEAPELNQIPRVRWVRDDSVNAGATLAHGVEMARGGVVTFLDDDDLYHPRRAEEVLRVFSQLPRVSYFHHPYRLFGASDGNPALLSDAPSSNLTVGSLARGWNRPESESGGSLEFAGFLSARNRERNLSSSAMRRDVLVPLLPYLRTIEGHTDTFLLFAALASGGELAFGSRPLTYVRRHAANTSRSTRDLSKRRGAWSVIRAMVDASQPSDELREYLAIREARSVIFERLAGEPLSRQDLWAATRVATRSWHMAGASNWAVDSALGVGGLLPIPGLDRAVRFVMG